MRQTHPKESWLLATAAFLADGEPTLTERATNLLRRAILSGVLQPGEKLAIHALADRFKIGTNADTGGIVPVG